MRKVLILLVIIVLLFLTAVFAGVSCKAQAVEETAATAETTIAETTSAETTAVTKKLSKIGYNILAGSGEHWIYMIQEVQQVCDSEGIELMVTDANINAEKQVADIEDMVNAGCDVIIAVSVDPVAIQTAVQYAHDKGVYVIADISQFENADAYVGFSEYEQGKVVGDYVGKWWTENRSGKIGYIIESNADDLGGDLPKRTDAMIETFISYVPGSEIVVNLTCWQEECGFIVMEDALVSNPEANLFFGSNNETTYGAVSALEAAGKKPGEDMILACVDNHYKMIEMIRDGKVLATNYINEPKEAQILVDVAKQLVEGTFEIGSQVLFETPVISKENAQEYLEKLEKYVK